ncbi:radical SAM protein [Azospirillum griseum]|nr:radical SAM protein [Azospirillum griseum]
MHRETSRTTALSAALIMDGPVLVFGGCYSNLEATQALLDAANELDIPPERMICTGDVVAYCADPQATVDLIRASGVAVVMGNCEESLGFGAEDCGCGFTEGSTCDRLSAAWFAHADRELDDDARAWMRSLPRWIDLIVGGRRLAVVHGSVERINAFLFASEPDDGIARQVALAGVDGVIGGHCGLPFTRIVEGALWHNAGAIGMPANDGTPRGWFSLIEPTAGGLEMHHRPLDYDHRLAARKIRAAGLPEPYAQALGNGLWPSCDVLPPAEIARRGQPLHPPAILWSDGVEEGPATTVPVPPRAKFSDPVLTATGERRAVVPLGGLKTLWFNTGTLCNIACRNCYIESSPRNDWLSYIHRDEVAAFLDEARSNCPELAEIGLTGGEPFMNPDILAIIEDGLSGGWRVLVLTNAMAPMRRLRAPLLDLHHRFPGQLSIRVSLDHHTAERHEEIRGPRSWEPALEGLLWLDDQLIPYAVAGRNPSDEDVAVLRAGYRSLFARLGLAIDADDPASLMIFPEMDGRADVPEITEGCWDILGKSPDALMCASSRMVVKHKGDERPTVVSCTLLPYQEAFDMGATLAEAARPVPLNHRYCAEFCVLGGASCSARGDRA